MVEAKDLFRANHYNVEAALEDMGGLDNYDSIYLIQALSRDPYTEYLIDYYSTLSQEDQDKFKDLMPMNAIHLVK